MISNIIAGPISNGAEMPVVRFTWWLTKQSDEMAKTKTIYSLLIKLLWEWNTKGTTDHEEHEVVLFEYSLWTL